MSGRKRRKLEHAASLAAYKRRMAHLRVGVAYSVEHTFTWLPSAMRHEVRINGRLYRWEESHA